MPSTQLTTVIKVELTQGLGGGEGGSLHGVWGGDRGGAYTGSGGGSGAELTQGLGGGQGAQGGWPALLLNFQQNF